MVNSEILEGLVSLYENFRNRHLFIVERASNERKGVAASSKAMQIVGSKKLKKDQDLFDAVDNLIGALDSGLIA